MRSTAQRVLSVAVDVFLLVVVLALVGLQFGPRVFPYRVFTVLSGSMSPNIPVGAEVVDVSVDPTTIRVGDVITFPHPYSPDELVTHRVVHVVERSPGVLEFFTKGDANGAEDPWKITPHATQLKVVFSVPGIGYVLSALSSATAHIILVVAVSIAGLAFLFDMWTRR